MKAKDFATHVQTILPEREQEDLYKLLDIIHSGLLRKAAATDFKGDKALQIAESFGWVSEVLGRF